MQHGVMSRRFTAMSSRSFTILPQLSAILLGMVPRRIHASGSQEVVRADCGNVSIGRANLSIGYGNLWIFQVDTSLCRVAWVWLAAPRARVGRNGRGSGPPRFVAPRRAGRPLKFRPALRSLENGRPANPGLPPGLFKGRPFRARRGQAPPYAWIEHPGEERRRVNPAESPLQGASFLALAFMPGRKTEPNEPLPQEVPNGR